MTEDYLISMLREADTSVLAETPESNPSRTLDCPPIGAYARYARENWPAGWSEHVGSCQYCQNRRAGTWSTQCPGWRILNQFVNDPHFVDRLAIERHLVWSGCQACAGKLRFFKGVTDWQANLEGWSTIRWDATPALAQAADNAPKSIWIPIRFENPTVEITIRQVVDTLKVRAETEDASFVGEQLELRLTGQVFEVRITLDLVDNGGKWAATGNIGVNDEQLKDLAGDIFVSLRVGKQEQPQASS